MTDTFSQASDFLANYACGTAAHGTGLRLLRFPTSLMGSSQQQTAIVYLKFWASLARHLPPWVLQFIHVFYNVIKFVYKLYELINKNLATFLIYVSVFADFYFCLRL